MSQAHRLIKINTLDSDRRVYLHFFVQIPVDAVVLSPHKSFHQIHLIHEK